MAKSSTSRRRTIGTAVLRISPTKYSQTGGRLKDGSIFSNHVAVVLNRELATVVGRDKIAAQMLEMPIERQLAKERIALLETVAKRLCFGGFLDKVCKFCLGDSVELACEPGANPRIFPKISEQSERVLLAICESFNPESRETANDIYTAYRKQCRSLKEPPKFKIPDTFCKDLYKQKSVFRGVMGHDEKYICGLKLKR